MIYRIIPIELIFSRTDGVRSTGEKTASDPVDKRTIVARPPALTRPLAKANGTLSVVMEGKMVLMTIVVAGSRIAAFVDGIVAGSGTSKIGLTLREAGVVVGF